MSNSRGRSLELFYVDGRPDGMLTAEMFNWTGHVLMSPRTQLSAALARPEASQTGVYLLLGELDGQPLAYIGEGEDIRNRIKSHDVSKEWWTSAVLVTTAGDKLNKAHVRYLEARLIEQAGRIARVPLENGNRPARPSLSEADVAKMEAFLENLMIVLPAVGVDLLIERARPARLATPAAVVADSSVPRFWLRADRRGANATAELRDGEFIVEAGSTAALTWDHEATRQMTYGLLRDELLRAGTLQERDGDLCFVENYVFRSPSAAAAVVLGRHANGTTEWKHEGSNQTYKDWEKRQLQTPLGVTV